MGTRSGTRVIARLVVILAVLVLIPLVGILGMMAMGGMMGGTMTSGQMGRGMDGMMSMHGWALLWMALLAVVLIGLIVFVIRGIRRT